MVVKSTLGGIGLAVAAVALARGTAAAHVFPTKAKLLKSSLVQSYASCTAPTTQTRGGLPACGGEPDPIDTVCGFGNAKTDGSLMVQAGKTGLKLHAALKGLSPTCDGQSLTIALRVRTTTDDCPDGHCIVTDQPITAGSCTVAKGKCAISATFPSPFEAGAGSEMTILDCGVRRGDVDTFRCGVMIP